MKRRLKVSFESDWHIGSGAGIPGSVDRQVLRDENGLPYIPGKTLTGVLRDAAEWIAYIRQDVQKDGKDWKGLVSSLFGEQPETHGGDSEKSAKAAKIGISSAELSEGLKRYIALADRQVNISDSLYKAHPGVKIDIETGKTEEDHLFSTERVRRDCVLYAGVTYEGTLSPEEEALFNDAVKAVRHIGGKRRRGAGECRLELGAPMEEGQGSAASAGNAQPDGAQPKDGFVGLDIRLTTLQPVIIARTTLGNAVRSDMEIPGSALLSYYVQDVLSPLGKRMSKAVMNAEISVSNFLPEFGDHPSLPVPLCLAEVKETNQPVNRLVTHDDSGQMKDLRTGYIAVRDNAMEYHSADNRRVIRTHNTVDDDAQRPTEKTGGLFTYEAIRAGQKFRGTLRIGAELWEEIKKDGAILKKLSRDEHSIGRSRKDEYGLVRLEYVNQADVRKEDAKLEKRNGGSYLAVYLLSDLLLRGTAGGYSVRLDDVRKALEAALGVELEDIPNDEWKTDDNGFSFSPLGGTRGHCVRVERRESWQGSWRLPRPSLVFFKAGSVFLFKVSTEKPWNEDKARALMNNGLGERRAEGYGRVLLNPAFLLNRNVTLAEQPRNDDEQNTEPQNVPLPGNDEDKTFAVDLALDSLRRHFRAVARHEAYDILRNENNAPFTGFNNVLWSQRPTASQFGNLREAAATMTDGENGTVIFRHWAENLERNDSDKYDVVRPDLAPLQIFL